MIGEPETDSSLFWQASPGHACEVPVSRPKLPGAQSILPYLQRIDATRIYSNGGPLARALKERMALHFAADATLSVNATTALALALMAQVPAEGALCMVPAWTFAASAHAIRMAGLVPWLVDVDPDTQQLTCELARTLLACAPGPVAAVMPVSPFGAPVDTARWDAFAADTGLVVVIDAAASFDTVVPGRTACVISLHATKVLGIGEGAVVVCSEPALIRKIEQRANFGFVDSREAKVPAFNAKLSEYGAAIGLAALDHWPQARASFMAVASSYRRHAERAGVALQHGFGNTWVSSTVVARLGCDMRLEGVVQSMSLAGIDVRCWWGGGLHRHAAFEACLRTGLPVTDDLARTSLGLPCSPDLSDTTIARICSILANHR